MLIRFSGMMCLQTCDAIKSRVLEFVQPEVATLFLDLSALTDVDSAGLGVLVGLHMTSRKQSISLVVLSPNPFQMKLMDSTRLSSVLTIESGVQAVKAHERLEKLENRLD